MKVSPVRIRATDFPSRRRRRRRDQNSSCCCLAMVLACGLIALVAARKPVARAIGGVFHREQAKASRPRPLFPLELRVTQAECYRYDVVPVEVVYRTADGSLIGDHAPEVRVRDAEGEVAETVGGLEEVKLRYDRTAGVWRGSWPVPFGAQTGPGNEYAFEASATFDPASWDWETPEARAQREKANKRRAREVRAPEPGDEATCTVRAPLLLRRREPPDLPPGTCVVTWEPTFPTGNGLIRPDGSRGDWRTMFDWAEFMGADTLWYRGAVTEVYSSQGALSFDEPWAHADLDPVPRMAAEAHKRGLKFGVWAVAMETYPNRPSQHQQTKAWKPDYRWTQDYSRSLQVPTEEAAVSLLDSHRPRNLAQFLAQMQATEGVDYVGFDYIRSGADWGSWELADEFAQTMSVVDLPRDWRELSPNQRMGWVCDRLDGAGRALRHADLYHQWNWFRAHKTSQMLRAVIDEAHLDKPLWCFTLSWWHGEQHGQDPMMFADAGVAIDAVMLYECDNVAHYESLLDQWRNGIPPVGAGIPPGQINIMGGDQVSMGSHRYLEGVTEPEELYRRITKAASPDKGLTKGAPLWGAFVHDVCRICSPALEGNRGPYPCREWALAGAAAFSTVRANWRVQPITCSLEAPKKAPVGTLFTASLRITNVCGADLTNLEVRVPDTPGINPITTPRPIPSLGADEMIEVPIQAEMGPPEAGRKHRYMLAVQVTWPEGDYGAKVRGDLPRLYTVMRYVNAG